MKKSVLYITLFCISSLISCENESGKTQSTDQQSTNEISIDTRKQLVEETVGQLNQALLAKDGDRLEQICAEGLTYGHSGGAVQNKHEFIADVVNGSFRFLSISMENQVIGIYEDLATVRNIFVGIGVNDGDTVDLRFGTAQLYKFNEDGQYKLILRQGYKL